MNDTLMSRAPGGTAVPFSAGTWLPSTRLQNAACDCHVHVYADRFPVAPGARLMPPEASASDYRQLQRRIGTTRAVLVTPSTYGTDNRCMLEGLLAMGNEARGVAVINGSESTDELRRLDGLGVRGIRINLSLGTSTTVDMLVPLANRIADLGWHLQLLMAPDLLVTLGSTLRSLPVPLVFDHFGRIAPTQTHRHPAHALLLSLLSAGRAWVKLSGGYLVSERHSVEDIGLDALARSYIAAAPERIVWGTDWPHATATAGVQPMPDDARQVDRLVEWTGDAATLHRVLVDNPQVLYGFPISSR